MGKKDVSLFFSTATGFKIEFKHIKGSYISGQLQRRSFEKVK
jgi:hypothetical protein